jgi:hypothetical protein
MLHVNDNALIKKDVKGVIDADIRHFSIKNSVIIRLKNDAAILIVHIRVSIKSSVESNR